MAATMAAMRSQYRAQRGRSTIPRASRRMDEPLSQFPLPKRTPVPPGPGHYENSHGFQERNPRCATFLKCPRSPEPLRTSSPVGPGSYDVRDVFPTFVKTAMDKANKHPSPRERRHHLHRIHRKYSPHKAVSSSPGIPTTAAEEQPPPPSSLQARPPRVYAMPTSKILPPGPQHYRPNFASSLARYSAFQLGTMRKAGSATSAASASVATTAGGMGKTGGGGGGGGGGSLSVGTPSSVSTSGASLGYGGVLPLESRLGPGCYDHIALPGIRDFQGGPSIPACRAHHYLVADYRSASVERDLRRFYGREPGDSSSSSRQAPMYGEPTILTEDLEEEEEEEEEAPLGGTVAERKSKSRRKVGKKAAATIGGNAQAVVAVLMSPGPGHYDIPRVTNKGLKATL